MKKAITLFCLILSLSSCGQKQKIKKEEIMTQQNIEKIRNIYKEIKTYDYNPSYTLHMNAGGLSFEVLINGNPIFSHYDSGNITGSIPINPSLINSGKQKIKIIITPETDENYSTKLLIDPNDVSFDFTIDCGDYGREKVKDFHEVFKYKMPKLKESLPIYELNLEFEAKVPYALNGWTHSVDLSKEDKQKLLKEVEAFYNEIINDYKNRDINRLADKYYNRVFELQQASYGNKRNDVQDIIDNWIIDANDDKPFILDQYQMKFYGDGKMVALVKTDKYYKNFSSLMREDKEGNYSCYGLILHRPTEGAPLEVIR
jgi:hypothetical protein